MIFDCEKSRLKLAAAYFVVDKAVHRTANSSKRHQETLDSDRCYGIDLNVPIEEYLPWSLFIDADS